MMFVRSLMFLVVLLISSYSESIQGYFVGDCTIGNDVNFHFFDDYYFQYGHKYFLDNVKDLFKTADFVIGNLETTITTKGCPSEKHFRFKGKPEYLDVLKAGNVCIVSIANNHIYDYGDIGYQETKRLLDSSGIKYYGFDDVLRENIKGKRISFLAFTGFGYDSSIFERVRKEKEVSDYIIVSIHWGQERNYGTIPIQTTIGHNLINSGADIVIGHHPHVIEPIEVYKKKFIIYSLGNFCFGGNSNPKDKDSFILKVSIDKHIKIDVIPIRISSVMTTNDFRPVVVIDKQSIKRIRKKLRW